MNYYLSLAALVPAVILFVRIYQLDRIEKEPRRLMKKHPTVRIFSDRSCFFKKHPIVKIFSDPVAFFKKHPKVRFFSDSGCFFRLYQKSGVKRFVADALSCMNPSNPSFTA